MLPSHINNDSNCLLRKWFCCCWSLLEDGIDPHLFLFCKLINAALTKGTIYPIVRSIASWFGKKDGKDVFAGFFKKSIPVVGELLAVE